MQERDLMMIIEELDELNPALFDIIKLEEAFVTVNNELKLICTYKIKQGRERIAIYIKHVVNDLFVVDVVLEEYDDYSIWTITTVKRDFVVASRLCDEILIAHAILLSKLKRRKAS